MQKWKSRMQVTDIVLFLRKEKKGRKIQQQQKQTNEIKEKVGYKLRVQKDQSKNRQEL